MAIKCLPPFYLSPTLFLISLRSRFNIYILDYCKKRGYLKTANQLVTEADISPESKPPINAQQGLLFESVSLSPFVPHSTTPNLDPYRWWSVFWVLFQAKNSGNGSEDAMLYHKVRPVPLFHLTPSHSFS